MSEKGEDSHCEYVWKYVIENMYEYEYENEYKIWIWKYVIQKWGVG